MNAERILRRIRNHPALFGELGAEKELQAERIRDKCKARLAPQWKARAEQARHDYGQRLLRLWA